MQPFTRRRALRAGGAATALALAGCLGDGATATDDGEPDEAAAPAESGRTASDGATGRLGEPAAAVTVEVASLPRPGIEPALVHLEPGGTVTWLGQGQRNSVVAYHPDTHGPRRIPKGAEPWSSGLLRAGDRFEVSLEEPGVYDYTDTTQVCGSHEAFGLVGRIVVGWPALAGQPAIEGDVDVLPSRAATELRALDDRCREVLR